MIFKRFLYFVLFLIPVSVFAVTYTLVDYYDTGDDSQADFYYYRAETFTATSTYSLIRVSAIMSGSSCSGTNLYAYVLPTTGGAPQSVANKLGQSDVVDCGSISGTPSWVNFDFSTPVSMVSGTVYAVAFSSSVESKAFARYDTSSGFSGGSAYYSLNSGSTWVGQAGADDYLFRTYYDSDEGGSPSVDVSATSTVTEARDYAIIVFLYFAVFIIGLILSIWILKVFMR